MDDKAGVAISLALVETLMQVPMRLAGDAVFQYVLEDETTGNGSLVCLAAGHSADAAIIIDGTRPDRAIDQHAGNLEFTLSVTGKSASVSVSHMGVNAAEKLAALVLHLRDAVLALNAGRVPPWDAFPSPCQFVTQSLHCPRSQLSVPDRAEATCYVTFTPNFTLQDMRHFLQSTTADFTRAWDPAAPVSFEWAYATEPVRSASDELTRTLQASAAALNWSPIEVGPSTGTSDMRHFVARDIPCLLYGPGRGFNPHRPDEHYMLEDLPRMVTLYLEVLKSWCGVSADAN
jgi:acetylornithine deacetylase